MVFNMNDRLFPNHKNVMLYDLETSGLNYYLDKILEFGYRLLKDGIEIESGSILINWGIEIPEVITSLTGITKEEIEEKGIKPQVFYFILKDLLRQSDLVIAHNAPFDVSFAHHFLLGMGDEGGIEDYDIDYFDSLTLVADHIAVGKKPRKPRKNSKEYETKMEKWEEAVKLVQTHKVMSVCNFYGIELNNAHRALADIVAVHEILKAFKKNNPKVDLDFYVNQWGYKKRWKIGELAYYPKRVSLSVQGTNGERYILDAEEHNLFK